MGEDDKFEPKPGKIRPDRSTRGRRYLHQVLRASALAGGRDSSSGTTRSATFFGNRIGRGAGAGRVLAARDRYAAFRERRVIVKTRIVKLRGSALRAARAHLRYVQRDGVIREGLPGELYDAHSDRADSKAFLARSRGDRHQFRFIVSAEDAVEHQDLRSVTRRLMTQMAEDLGTQLDWVAVDHYNTGHPHTHIVLRGKDDRGRDLVIAREYIAHGMRERAAEIVTFDLGPRSDLEIERKLRDEAEEERFTSHDRSLLREADAEGVVRFGGGGGLFRQALRAARLQKLSRLGLAAELVSGRWQLVTHLEPTLRRMGERGDIIKTLHREMSEKGIARSTIDYAIYDPADAKAQRLVGRHVARGLCDELNDRHFLVVDGLDGRVHYVDIGRGNAMEDIPVGAVVSLQPRRVGPRTTDRTIASIAAANGGRYNVDIHLQHDQAETTAYAEMHLRRLEALRRLGGIVERGADSTWIIAPDYLERVAAFERMRARAAPVIVQMLSSLPLERQVTADGATWLDRQLVAEDPEPLRESGFGGEVHQALARRRQWLVEQALARQDGDRMVYRANMLGILWQRELARVADQLSAETGLPYVALQSGNRVEGICRRRVDLVSGSFALIENTRAFTLVPWRSILVRAMGKRVSGVALGGTVSWTFGRKRTGPEIS